MGGWLAENPAFAVREVKIDKGKVFHIVVMCGFLCIRIRY